MDCGSAGPKLRAHRFAGSRGPASAIVQCLNVRGSAGRHND